jgi:hypothetical protein
VRPAVLPVLRCVGGLEVSGQPAETGRAWSRSNAVRSSVAQNQVCLDAHPAPALPASLAGGELLALTAPIPVQLLMGRANLRGAQLVVERHECFEGKPVLVLTGENAEHPREADLATVEWLRGLGANVDYHFLGDHGIHGNGHMLMSEDNSNEIADIAAAWLRGQPADS